VADFVWQEYMTIIDLKLNQNDLEVWGRNIATSKFKNYKEFLEKTQEICF
jgi:hypothetical protein